MACLMKKYIRHIASLWFPLKNNITEMSVTNQTPRHLREKNHKFVFEIHEQILLTNQTVSTVRHQEGERESRAKGKVKVGF